MTRTIETVRAELAVVEAEIDAAYWAFTRQARGRLAPHATYLRCTALKAELKVRLQVPARADCALCGGRGFEVGLDGEREKCCCR